MQRHANVQNHATEQQSLQWVHALNCTHTRGEPPSRLKHGHLGENSMRHERQVDSFLQQLQEERLFTRIVLVLI